MMWRLVAIWVFCPTEASRGMNRLASSAFVPALLPTDSRVWVRRTHSQLRAWTNQCNLSQPWDWFRPRATAVSAGHSLTTVAGPVGSVYMILRAFVHRGRGDLYVPHERAVPGDCLQLCRKPEDKANAKLREWQNTVQTEGWLKPNLPSGLLYYTC